MKYFIALIVGLLILGFIVPKLEDEVQIKLQVQLNQVNEQSVQERLFVHIDNNLVEPGKSVWFKAYLTKSETLESSLLSQVLFIDLLTHQGEKVLEYRFLLDSGRVNGSLYMPDWIVNDNYILSAYTTELKKFNLGYSQVLEVANYNSLFEKCKLSFEKDSYKSGDEILFDLETRDINNKLVGKVNYEYKLYNQGVVIKEGKGRTDKSGMSSHVLALDPNQYLHNPLVVITTSINAKKRDFYFEIPRTSYEVENIKFFPEGGSLIQGRRSLVGFIATDEFGKLVDFHGVVVNENERVVSRVDSSLPGMGSFNFKPENGQSYFLKTAKGRKFSLPIPSINGYGISLVSGSENNRPLKFELFRSTEMDSVVHTALIMNGKVDYFSRCHLSQTKEIEIPVDRLENGVGEFCMYDRFGVKLASRRILMNGNKKINFEFKLSDGAGETDNLVDLLVIAKDEKMRPIQGDFSVAITEDFSLFHGGFVKPDIISSLLFESRISSIFSNGNKFFLNDLYSSGRINDLLLVLDFEQKEWLKNVTNLTKENRYAKKEYLRGVVLDKDNAPQSGVDIVAIVKGSWDRSIVTSDKFGFFQLPISLLSQENTGFIIGLANEKEYKNLKLKIEGNNYLPNAISHLSLSDLVINTMAIEKNADFKNARILPNVDIVDENFHEDFLKKKVAHYGNFTSIIKDGSQLKTGVDFLAYLRQTTNIAYVDRPIKGNIVFRGVPKAPGQTFGGGGYPALFILDDVPLGYNFHDLDYLSVDQIKSINIIKSSSAVVTYGTRATGGVIIVKTGSPDQVSSTELFTQKKLEQNLLNEMDRAISVDFFEPIETFDTSIDNLDSRLNEVLKTTLYWSPNLKFDENGMAQIKYKNTSLPSKISITINGISDDLRLGTGSTSYFVNPK